MFLVVRYYQKQDIAGTNFTYIGNATFAGATAAISANVVLVAYVVVAMREDQSEAIALAEKEKKGR